DLRADVNKIRDKFFATGSKHVNFLDNYVRGELALPVTTSGVRGLPKVLRRGVVESQDSKPNLLFLDLLHPPPSVGVPVPERFRSNVLLGVLEKMQAQYLPVFGVRELTILYCGTGLSIRTLHWAMRSGDGIKEYGSNTFPYIEFPGWTGADSVQAYVDRLKEQLPDDKSKRQVDILVLSVAVETLHKRLTGRFRPIVTAIEGIFEIGKWNTAIDKTATMITSWMDGERRGNLCGELNR
ncbi:hypothetical protein BG011_001681, partial [Mortierella polycephala]